MTALVGRERAMGVYFAIAVPMKGSMGNFTVDKVIDMIDEVGDEIQTVTIKTDQESSLKALVDDVVAFVDTSEVTASYQFAFHKVVIIF